MTLTLPADAEIHIPDGEDLSYLHNAGVYCLILTRPSDPGAAWDAQFEHRPEWFEQFRDAPAVWYVGAASDVLARLEDHRDGEVRTTVLTEVCEIDSLRNIWWFDSPGDAFERESGMAVRLQNEYDAYVHQR